MNKLNKLFMNNMNKFILGWGTDPGVGTCSTDCGTIAPEDKK